MGRFTMSNIKKKANTKVHDDVLTKMWNGVRLNNGIMVLLKLLGTKTPITDADSLRALACKVGQGFFLVSSGAEIRPLSQWDLGDFFPNLKKKIHNLKKKKKIFFFFFLFFLEFSHTHTQAT